MNAIKVYLSVEEYLEGERDGEIRHEYGAGKIYPMVGASDRHGLLEWRWVRRCSPLPGKNAVNCLWPI